MSSSASMIGFVCGEIQNASHPQAETLDRLTRTFFGQRTRKFERYCTSYALRKSKPGETTARSSVPSYMTTVIESQPGRQTVAQQLFGLSSQQPLRVITFGSGEDASCYCVLNSTVARFDSHFPKFLEQIGYERQMTTCSVIGHWYTVGDFEVGIGTIQQGTTTITDKYIMEIDYPPGRAYMPPIPSSSSSSASSSLTTVRQLLADFLLPLFGGSHLPNFNPFPQHYYLRIFGTPHPPAGTGGASSSAPPGGPPGSYPPRRPGPGDQLLRPGVPRSMAPQAHPLPPHPLSQPHPSLQQQQQLLQQQLQQQQQQQSLMSQPKPAASAAPVAPLPPMGGDAPVIPVFSSQGAGGYEALESSQERDLSQQPSSARREKGSKKRSGKHRKTSRSGERKAKK